MHRMPACPGARDPASPCLTAVFPRTVAERTVRVQALPTCPSSALSGCPAPASLPLSILGERQGLRVRLDAVSCHRERGGVLGGQLLLTRFECLFKEWYGLIQPTGVPIVRAQIRHHRKGLGMIVSENDFAESERLLEQGNGLGRAFAAANSLWPRRSLQSAYRDAQTPISLCAVQVSFPRVAAPRSSVRRTVIRSQFLHGRRVSPSDPDPASPGIA